MAWLGRACLLEKNKKIILVKLTSMFDWIYQYSGTFNQNNFL